VHWTSMQAETTLVLGTPTRAGRRGTGARDGQWCEPNKKRLANYKASDNKHKRIAFARALPIGLWLEWQDIPVCRFWSNDKSKPRSVRQIAPNSAKPCEACLQKRGLLSPFKAVRFQARQYERRLVASELEIGRRCRHASRAGRSVSRCARSNQRKSRYTCQA